LRKRKKEKFFEKSHQSVKKPCFQETSNGGRENTLEDPFWRRFKGEPLFSFGGGFLQNTSNTGNGTGRKLGIGKWKGAGMNASAEKAFLFR